MQKPTLHKYLKALTHVKRGSTKFGMAPHKPVLLITLVELMQKKTMPNNRFEINADFVGMFQENWELLVQTANHADFTQPFYYLQSDKVENQSFWTLHAKPGCQINSYVKSINTLVQVLDYGSLAEDLFILLTDSINNQLILDALLTTYFPSSKSIFLKAKQEGSGYFHELEEYILNEPEVKLRKIKVETEDEFFVRGALFKRSITRLYQSTCAFTGMRLTSTYGHSFIDACHIVPFSVSLNDKVSNGIALCPNMHRAFDRGLISISGEYKLMISSHVYEDEEHEYSLNRLRNKLIKLPQTNQYWPSQESLEWHRKHVFNS